MADIARAWRHLITTRAAVRRAFPEAALQRIEAAVRASEARHSGQLCIALEAALPLRAIEAGVSPLERAREVFAQLGVWDTAANNGVLIYLLWADRDIEIVADRGIHGVVGSQAWADVCTLMKAQLASGDAAGALHGAVEAVTALLETHFPDAREPNALPDRPHLL